MGTLSELDTNALVAMYRDAAVGQSEGGLTGKALRAANRKASKVAAVYRELRTRDARSVLLVLLEDADPSVRLWAASHALEFDPAEGEPVLEKLANDQDSEPLGTRFNAQITLEQWRGGAYVSPERGALGCANVSEGRVNGGALASANPAWLNRSRTDRVA
jgi:hypothetical protein